MNTVELNNGLADLEGQFHAIMPMQNVVGSDNSAVNNVGLSGPFSFSAKTLPLSDITNQATTQPRNGSKKNGQNWSERLVKILTELIWKCKKVGDWRWSSWSNLFRRKSE